MKSNNTQATQVKPKRAPRVKAATKVTPEPEVQVTYTESDNQMREMLHGVFSTEHETPEEKTFRYLNRKSFHEANKLFREFFTAYQVVWKKMQEDRLKSLTPIKPERLDEIGQKAYETEYQELWSLRWNLKNAQYNVLEFKNQIDAQLTPECGWTVEEILNHRR